jgi:hypothetical protein
VIFFEMPNHAYVSLRQNPRVTSERESLKAREETSSTAGGFVRRKATPTKTPPRLD